ncbi:hypothetical protein FPSE_07406 [Fusarium pseudograminearum CS3096]|uniref:Uncharacterized protein n=1 Tax=Fusarium pseudograminearum (strain CS3096) TaxID=1028729 RepID=K3VE34_FUSPC|nr:hypothetical protein FPSE_07406 [Fusarium pseudograminearum CS3096]EKJ72382.1 hypothetical protein FPSE_07406 [Fusarium pseudograminearum CS3096]
MESFSRNSGYLSMNKESIQELIALAVGEKPDIVTIRIAVVRVDGSNNKALLFQERSDYPHVREILQCDLDDSNTPVRDVIRRKITNDLGLDAWKVAGITEPKF